MILGLRDSCMKMANILWLQRLLRAILFILVFILGVSVSAQDTASTLLQPPDISVNSLEQASEQIAESETLSEDLKQAATDNYDTAIRALRTAAANTETINRFQREISDAPALVEQLRAEVKEARAASANLPEADEGPMTGETLLKLEQDLITQDGELRTIKAEIERYNTELKNLLQRPITAREELADARVRLAQITTDLADLGETELDVLGTSRRTAFQAQEYYRRSQILALEQEIAGLSARQQIVTARRDLAQLRAQTTEQQVNYLQAKTGQKRLMQASDTRSQNIAALNALEDAHPLVVESAQENVALSEILAEAARDSSEYPKRLAETRSAVDIIDDDLRVAQQLIDLGNLNRESSGTLRRLRNQGQSVSAIEAAIKETRQSIIEATQGRLTVQDQLRNFPLGQIQVDVAELKWRVDNPDGPTVTPTDIEALQGLHSTRRDLLLEISEAASARVTDAASLQTLQTEQLTKSKALKDILDRNLLWLPSVSAVDLGWPRDTLMGFFKTFSLENLSTAISVFMSQIQRLWLMVLLFVGVIGVLLSSRKRLRIDVRERSGKVGRVQRDSYLHTPSVILVGIIKAAPLPLFFLLCAVLFLTSDSTNVFVNGLDQTFLYLASFVLFFLTWREWNREKSLFDVHFKLQNDIRQSINRQLRWFVPLAATFSAIIWLTEDSPDPDVHEGLSVFAFVTTAISLSVFAFNVLWSKRSAFDNLMSSDSPFWRYRKLFAVLAIGLPVIAAGLAIGGYYDTAYVLLGRLFMSGILLICTYVVYGLIRRTVLVAQRRLALKQAVERRDMAIKARKEKEAAEERGDVSMPQVNYEEIDVETVSRQTSQLLYTLMALGFAALMWVIWSPLLPALSIFNDVGLWPNEYVTNADGERIVESYITLWNVMQVGVILFLTYIAAKNLPAFLEIFVLNRAGVDAGTRYAIVTILGYTIVAVGLFIGFTRLGIDWSKLQWFVAALGVGIGFGLQEIIANFISGLIILFERPIRLGDYVTIGDQSGTVTRIKIRATTLADLDNREILIPNKELITGRVTNWTLSNSITRLKIPVGIAYGSDTDKAGDIIMDVLRNNPNVLDKPSPQALFLGFGDSSLDFEIRVFLKSFEDRFPVQHALHVEINKALEKAGITIPFPQTDLNIMSQAVPIEFKSQTSRSRKKSAIKSSASKPKTTG